MSALCFGVHVGYEQNLICNREAGHRGPHSAPGERPVVGAAWCTPPIPCRGGLCPGPCHALDPLALAQSGLLQARG